MDLVFFVVGFFVGQDCFIKGVFYVFEVDFDFVVDVYFVVVCFCVKFFQWYVVFDFQIDIDDGKVFFDGNDSVFGDCVFIQVVLDK